MSHPFVKYIETDTRGYNTFKGPGWYFLDPFDDEAINVAGPYATEDLAQREYYAYCSAMDF